MIGSQTSKIGDLPDKGWSGTVSDWLDTLRDGKGRGVIQTRLNRIAQGNLGDCKSVGDGISELRIDFGPGYRVYFGMDEDKVILLLGGDKSTQASDIRDSKTYWS